MEIIREIRDDVQTRFFNFDKKLQRILRRLIASEIDYTSRDERQRWK